MRSLYAIAAAALAVTLAPAAVLAAGYAVPNTNTRDEGMAGATVANQVGPEAAFANGAALAGQEGLGISGGVALIALGSTWTNPEGGVGAQAQQSTIPKAAFPPNLNIAYGMNLGGIPVAAGFAFAVPFGGLVYWPYAWAGNANIIHVDRRVYSYELVGAAEVMKGLKLSIGGALYYGTEKLEQGLDFGTSIGDVQLGTSGTGLGWSAAVDYKPVQDVPFKIGLQYKHQSYLNLSGNGHFEGVPPTFQTQGLVDASVTHTLVLPNILNGGVSFDPIPGLTVDLAVTFWRFIVYKDDTFISSKGLTVQVPRNYTNSMTYRLGAEYKLPFYEALTVRSGVLRDVTPQPTDTLDPSLPEASKWAWQVGLTWQITDAFSVSAANEYVWYDEVTTTGPNAFPGTYDTHAEIADIGVTWRWK